MANAKWNSFPGLTAQELDDADLLPLSDMSQAEGQRDRTVSIGALKEVTAPVPAAGATGERPGSPPVGSTWFDTTLGQPVWWDGSAWVDALGEPA